MAERTYLLSRLGNLPIARVEHGALTYSLHHTPRHSPDGFEWGYGGSGPSDLALAIVNDLTGKPDGYQAVKEELVTRVPYEGGAITEEQIRAVLDARAGDEAGPPTAANSRNRHLHPTRGGNLTITEKVHEILRNELGLAPTGQIDPGATFIDLGADSLDVVEITMSIEEEFGLDIADETVEGWENVAGCIAWLETRAST